MIEKFKLWSETHPEAKKVLAPDLGIRNWDELNMLEKSNIMKYFEKENYFGNLDIRIYVSIQKFNDSFKSNAYCPIFLNHLVNHGFIKTTTCCIEAAYYDFINILQKENHIVVYELLSFYAKNQILNDILNNLEKTEEIGKMTPQQINQKINSAYQNFDTFSEVFNDIFTSFGLDVILTRSGLIPRQETKITNEIYIPVLKFLSNPKWNEVSRELGDAFKDYTQKTKEGYSACITHTVSALQAFLQILVYNKTGKGDLSDLLKDSISKSLIPNDPFSKTIFNNMQSILMTERQLKSDSHPKKEYANELHARLLLNITMVFIQHCIQNTKL